MKLAAAILASSLAFLNSTASADVYYHYENVFEITDFVDFSNLQAQASGDFSLKDVEKVSGQDPVTGANIWESVPYEQTGYSSYSLREGRKTYRIAQEEATDFRAIREGNLLKTQQRYIETTEDYKYSSLYISSSLRARDLYGSGTIIFAGDIQYNEKSKDIIKDNKIRLPSSIEGSAGIYSNFVESLSTTISQNGTLLDSSEKWPNFASNPSDYEKRVTSEFKISDNFSTSFNFVINAKNLHDGYIFTGISAFSEGFNEVLAQTHVERWETISTTIAPVPEPETYALMGIGLVGLMVARRRKMAN